MKTFSALLAICERNSPVPGEFPTQRPVGGGGGGGGGGRYLVLKCAGVTQQQVI